MATFTMNEADNYGNSGSGSFFVLKNDNEKAKVRFLYNDMNDVQGHAVHKVDVGGGKERYVNCLRAYNEPLEKCPLCAAKIKVQPRLFVKLYNEDAGECQIWERGKKFFPTLADLCSHHNPLVNEVVEITRHGKPGDQQTTYTTYPVSNSEVDLDAYESADPLGTIILDKSFEELQHYISTGSFPNEGAGQVNNYNNNNYSNMPSGRRTPSNNMPF